MWAHTDKRLFRFGEDLHANVRNLNFDFWTHIYFSNFMLFLYHFSSYGVFCCFGATPIRSTDRCCSNAQYSKHGANIWGSVIGLSEYTDVSALHTVFRGNFLYVKERIYFHQQILRSFDLISNHIRPLILSYPLWQVDAPTLIALQWLIG